VEPIPTSADHREQVNQRWFSWWAAAGGLAIGGVLCVFNLLVMFKTGIAFGGSALAVLLGAAWLRARRQLNLPRLFVVFSLASSGYLATGAIDSGFAANYLRTSSVPSWLAMAGIALLASGYGLVLGALMSRMLLREKLSYPTLQPAIALMKGFRQRGDVLARPLLVSAGVGATIALAVAFIAPDGTPVFPNVPPYLSITISPMLFGVGALTGSRSAVWFFAGGVYSAVVWSQSDPTASYTEHLSNRWVVAIGIGIMVGYSVAMLLRLGLVMRHAVPRPAGGGEDRRPALLALGAIILATTIGLCGWYGILRGLEIAALVTSLTLLLAVFLLRVGAETGIAPLSAVIFLGIIVFRSVGLPITDSIVLAAAIASVGMSALYYAYAIKVSSSFGPDTAQPTRRTVLWTQGIGGWFGALVGIALLTMLLRPNVMGSAAFPAPLVRAFGFVSAAYTAGSAQSDGTGPTLIGALLLGLLLTFAPVSPSSIGLGILLPPPGTLALALGGLAAWVVLRRAPRRKELVTTVASGLVIGEGLVTTVAMVIRTFT
jgi:hypothetical protein